jgi:alkylation response protein AidB-like acyl-CoA dehydrogenase
MVAGFKNYATTAHRGGAASGCQSIYIAMQDTMQARQTQTFDEMISSLKSTLKDLFDERNQDIARLKTRGLTTEELRSIMKCRPLSVAIPKEFGGRGLNVRECLKVLETASYESIPLTLIFGINIALFLEPVAKYGAGMPRAGIYADFLENGAMGGLMISEPGHGSDALNMMTSHHTVDDMVHIKGQKHWQGLSGDADYWLVASRESRAGSSLSRDISLFVTDNAQPSQHIPLIERYENNGLLPISYGLNDLDIQVPSNQALQPETTGIKMLMDILHRSRMQFPGMAMGYIRRVLEETTAYVNERQVRGKSLLQFDQVKHQLAQLQSAFTVCSAMCKRSTEISGIDKDLALLGVEANAIKAKVTDLMQFSAQTMTQLFGSSGYKITNRGSRGIMDSRPFQIFEGPNEMLYSQISEMVTKQMRKLKMTLSEYLAQYDLTASVATYFKSVTDQVTPDSKMPQRKHVVLGQAISNIIAAAYAEDLNTASFNKSFVDNTIDSLKVSVSDLLNNFDHHQLIDPLLGYDGKSDWAVS